jgi:hypothetical protein
MSDKKPGVRKYPLDRLMEKHERMAYDAADAKRLEVDVAGEPATVLFSEYLPDVRVVKVTRDGDLLFVLGEVQAPPSWGMNGDGVIIVARRERDGVYAARAWHVLYPGTVEQLVGEPKGSEK